MIPVDVLYSAVLGGYAMELTAAAIYDQIPVHGTYTLDATLVTKDNAKDTTSRTRPSESSAPLYLIYSLRPVLLPGEAPIFAPLSAPVTSCAVVQAQSRVAVTATLQESQGGDIHEDDKGSRHFSGPVRGGCRTFNSWDGITKWAADKGYVGVQVPTWAGRSVFDLKKASESKDYCDEFAGVARNNGIEVTELSTHLQGQLVAVHPAYDEAFDGFAAPEVRGNPKHARPGRWSR